MKNKEGIVVYVLMVLTFFWVNIMTVSATGNAPDTETGTDTAVLDIKEREFSIDTTYDLVEKESYVRAGLLYDTEKEVVVWSKNMHSAYPIASLTKMMVALLAAEDVLNCKATWSDTVKVVRRYKSRRGGVYKRTETYTLESIVQLALIPSNNMACSDIGIHLEGSVAAFVKRMNAKAKSLGMNNTFYSNPSGLPASYSRNDNRSSPHDLLILALELVNNPDLLKLTSIGYVEINNGINDQVHRNNNRLVIDFENQVDGLKTGYTRRAQSCLAATANKDGYRIISIVLGVGGPYLRNEIVSSMLNNYYETIGCGGMVKCDQPPLLQKSVLTPAAVGYDEDIAYRLVWSKEKKVHKVRSGETLSGIGARYGISYSKIKRWNGLRSNRIYKGQRLYVYVSTQKRIAVRSSDEKVTEKDLIAKAEEKIQKKPVATKPEKKITTSSPVPKVKSYDESYDVYTVQPGDTLWNIAKRFDGITVDDIRKMNKIRSPKALMPGTKLKIKKQS
jgi:D-alanyl-D-alanine carboxypeptidase